MRKFWCINPSGVLRSCNILRADEFVAMGQAEDIHAAARAAEKKIMEQARQQAQQVLQEAHAAGFEAGLAAARNGLINLTMDSRRQAQVIGRSAATLLIGALQQVIGQLPDVVVLHGLVERALEQVEPDVLIALRVAPDAVESATQFVSALEYKQFARSIQVVADPDLSATDCILCTPFGSVNASLSVQLRALNQALGQAVDALAHAQDTQCTTV